MYLYTDWSVLTPNSTQWEWGGTWEISHYMFNSIQSLDTFVIDYVTMLISYKHTMGKIAARKWITTIMSQILSRHMTRTACLSANWASRIPTVHFCIVTAQRNAFKQAHFQNSNFQRQEPFLCTQRSFPAGKRAIIHAKWPHAVTPVSWFSLLPRSY